MFSRHVYSMSVTPHSLSNTKLGLRLWNTIIKIVKMLVKIIILLFIMMMSIVLINLIIGLAINDIATLR